MDIKKYLSKLNKNEFQGSFVKVIESARNVCIQNINVLSFNSMYANISVLLFNEKIIPETELENIEKIKKYLSTKDPQLKIFTNSYFGYLHNLDPFLSGYIVQISCLIMKDIFEKNKNIIYIDTDMIFYTGDNIDLLDVSLKYNKTKYDYLLINAIKRYVFTIDGKVFIRGYSHRKRGDRILKNDISKIKSIIRDNKLNEILL